MDNLNKNFTTSDLKSIYKVNNDGNNTYFKTHIDYIDLTPNNDINETNGINESLSKKHGQCLKTHLINGNCIGIQGVNWCKPGKDGQWEFSINDPKARHQHHNKIYSRRR